MDSVLRELEQLTCGVFREVITGSSYEGRRIRVFKCGNGRVKVLAWSQMHGNEPTSTLALMDAMKYLEQGGGEAAEILDSITLIAIPMLNPDGYIRYDRRNSQGIDVNRDAQSLISPEARLLMKVWEDFKPDFALNLHDQETRYTSLQPLTPSLLAMLAPECNYEKSVTPARERAMKAIAAVADKLQDIAAGRIAKYDDVYTPTAFGDTFMKLGTSSILIEAGSEPGDPGRIKPRAAMSKAIITALKVMASGCYNHYDVQQYDSLPLNKDFDGYDLLIKGIKVIDPLGDYTTDIAIRRVKTSCNPEDFADDFDDFRILNIGCLGNAPAVKTADWQGYTLRGSHSDLYIGRKADIEAIAPDGKIINVQHLLKNDQH
ncbi:MAG: hypothetical protein II075_12930 [Bacteroidales bacterium]|nr:hypothetical protein [Bacteroidales bacterium]